MNWRRAFIATLVALPIVALLAYGLTQDPKEIPSPLPGKSAPVFALPVFAAGTGATALPVGDTVRLADYRGQVVVLNFWASWCLECRVEHQLLSQVATLYHPRGVRFLGVLYNDQTPNGLAWIRDMGGQSYPSLDDGRSRTAIDYGLYGVPETFFIARDGRVAYKQIGPISEGVLLQKLDSLLAAPAPAVYNRCRAPSRSGGLSSCSCWHRLRRCRPRAPSPRSRQGRRPCRTPRSTR
jgi:cytochrome c biogenesis protein CcmG/thiol:disulfide interchange protein DsbE